MYSYRKSEPELWTVGLVEQEDGRDVWLPESDHSNVKSAADRVAFLNGGCEASESRPIKQQISGLSKREYFAALAMQSLVAVYPDRDRATQVAKTATAIADALIAEFAKE